VTRSQLTVCPFCTATTTPESQCIPDSVDGSRSQHILGLLRGLLWESGTCRNDQDRVVGTVRQGNLKPTCTITKSTHTPVCTRPRPLTRHPFVRPALRYLESWWIYVKSAFSSLQWLARKRPRSRSTVQITTNLSNQQSTTKVVPLFRQSFDTESTRSQ